MAIESLQGVWFPVAASEGGRLKEVREPCVPAPPEVLLLRILGGMFFVTSHGDYCWTGGLLRHPADGPPGRLEFVYPHLPEPYDAEAVDYQVSGDELRIVRLAWDRADRYARLSASHEIDMRPLVDRLESLIRCRT